ncbi:MAG: hypothetical protein WC554_19725 [Clostridia bacterium]|jgi:hypothetical protein
MDANEHSMHLSRCHAEERARWEAAVDLTAEIAVARRGHSAAAARGVIDTMPPGYAREALRVHVEALIAERDALASAHSSHAADLEAVSRGAIRAGETIAELRAQVAELEAEADVSPCTDCAGDCNYCSRGEVALISERDAAIARAEKAEEQRDRARAWASKHHGAMCQDGGPCNCERLVALADDPPKAQP